MGNKYIGTKVFVTARERLGLQKIWRNVTRDAKGKPIPSTASDVIQHLATTKYNLPELPDHLYGFNPQTGEFLAPENWERIAGDQP